MSRRLAFGQLILARVREFYREPEVIFWVYGFPLILATILGIAFSSRAPQPPTVDVQGQAGDAKAEALARTLAEAHVSALLTTPAESKTRFKKGQTDLIVIPTVDGVEYVVDPARDKSLLARYWIDDLLVRAKLKSGTFPLQEKMQTEPGSRYIDFLLPGLIGINIMGGGLFGVGFVLVDMRVRKLFKRLMATPMHRGDFLAAMITSRLIFLCPEMLSLLLAGWLIFGVKVTGSWVALFCLIMVGAFAFAGIGLLLGCRTEKTETISGLINLVMLPSYLVSGVFFASERFPDFAQPLIKALPLTQLIDALRAVMLDGAGLWEVSGQLVILFLWASVTFTVGLRWFRWQ